jgi:hypothetical protein
VALRIDTAASSALQSGGREAYRVEPLRRRDAREDIADGAPPAVQSTSPLPERIGAAGGVRDARLQRISASDPLQGSALRGGARAYVAVARNTITEPAGGELVGIDLYV